MGKEYLIDTNGVSHFLRKAFSAEGMKFLAAVIDNGIIAATALVNDMTLITRNTNDFKGINKLKMLNLHKTIPKL